MQLSGTVQNGANQLLRRVRSDAKHLQNVQVFATSTTVQIQNNTELSQSGPDLHVTMAATQQLLQWTKPY